MFRDPQGTEQELHVCVLDKIIYSIVRANDDHEISLHSSSRALFSCAACMWPSLYLNGAEVCR